MSTYQLTKEALSDVQKQLKDFDEKLVQFSKNSKQVYDPLDVLIQQMKHSPSETDMALYEHYLGIIELQRKTVNQLADIQLVLLDREEHLKERLQGWLPEQSE
jgi:Ni,Fe-hydrogenase I large subunit